MASSDTRTPTATRQRGSARDGALMVAPGSGRSTGVECRCPPGTGAGRARRGSPGRSAGTGPGPPSAAVASSRGRRARRSPVAARAGPVVAAPPSPRRLRRHRLRGRRRSAPGPSRRSARRARRRRRACRARPSQSTVVSPYVSFTSWLVGTTTMRFGATRYGPVAPCACQFGKYDVRTSTGLPISETWNEIVSTSSWISETCVGIDRRLGRAPELLDVDVLPRLRARTRPTPCRARPRS